MIAQAYCYSPSVAYGDYPMMEGCMSPRLAMPSCSEPYQSLLNSMNLMLNLEMSGFMQGYLDGLAARTQMSPYPGFPPGYYDASGPCEQESYEHQPHVHKHRPHLHEILREREGVVTSQVPDGGDHRRIRLEDRPERKVTIDLATNQDGSAQTKTTVVATPEVETVQIKDVDNNPGNSAVVVEGDHVTVTNPGEAPGQTVVTEYQENVGLVEGLGRGIDQFFGGKPEPRTFENVSQVDIVHNQDGSQATLVTDADGQMHSVQAGPDGWAQKTGEWVDDRVHEVVDFTQNLGQGVSDWWNSPWQAE